MMADEFMGARAALFGRFAFGEELFHFGSEIIGGIDVTEFAGFIEEPHGGDPFNAELFAEFVIEPGRIEILGPRDVFFSNEGGEVFFFVIHANGHDFEAFGVEFVVGGLHDGDFLDARRAPGGPEIDEHDFTAKLSRVDVTAVQRGVLDIDRLADQFGAGRGIFAAGERKKSEEKESE